MQRKRFYRICYWFLILPIYYFWHCREVIESIGKTYYLVNLVDNDFPKGNCLFNVLDDAFSRRKLNSVLTEKQCLKSLANVLSYARIVKDHWKWKTEVFSGKAERVKSVTNTITYIFTLFVLHMWKIFYLFSIKADVSISLSCDVYLNVSFSDNKKCIFCKKKTVRDI